MFLPPPVSLPKLEPLRHLDRGLTVSEYFHASIGRSPRTLVRGREVVFVIEGETSSASIDWQSALDRVVALNPGCRLRLAGKRQSSRWISDGNSPRLRFIENCDWDGRSENGAEFLHSTVLSLEEGNTAELIVAGQKKIKLIFRVSHAVMDGIGALHFLQELFRALRGEPLLGTNATFSDSELKKSVPSETVSKRKFQPAYITGGAQGTERGGGWRRITINGPQPNLLPRIVSLLTEFSRLSSDSPVRIAIPSNLRRHVPELLTTMNFTGMPYLDLDPDESLDLRHIKKRLKEIQDKNVDAKYARKYELIRYLPFGWVDSLLSVTEKNFRSPPIFETAVLTVLGSFKQAAFSGGGFTAERLYVLPQLDNVFLTVTGLQRQFEICVGMPGVFASNGRMDKFLEFLEHRLKPGNDIEMV